ncbi:MAG: hypothetical protein HW421_3029 [Ignavibacteria bacterium]|nr:hypothetical protein [Ignavibacteria bacterium]
MMQYIMSGRMSFVSEVKNLVVNFRLNCINMNIENEYLIMRYNRLLLTIQNSKIKILLKIEEDSSLHSE